MDKLKEKKTKVVTHDFWNKTEYIAQYYECGPKNGPVFLFIHGIQTSLFIQYPTLLEPIMKKFKHFRYIFPMLQGHGSTTNERLSVRGSHDVIANTNFTKEFLLSIGIRDVEYVMGHSLGATIALEVSLEKELNIKNVISCQPLLPLSLNIPWPRIVTDCVYACIDMLPPLGFYKSMMFRVGNLSKSQPDAVKDMHDSYEMKMYDMFSARELLKSVLSVVLFSTKSITANTLLSRAGMDKLTPHWLVVNYPENVKEVIIPGVYHEIHNEKPHLARKQTKIIEKFIKRSS